MKLNSQNIKLVAFLYFISLFYFTDVKSQNYRSDDTIQAHIDVDSAYLIIQANASNPQFILLDVRTITEYNIYHLKNGVMLDYNALAFDSMLNTLDKNKTYLIYCASGGRSGNAFNIMQTKKFKYIYNMLGGISTWNIKGYPTTVEVSPIIMSVSDTLLQFDSLYISDTDTIPVTITNYGNGILNLSKIVGISGSDFYSDFVAGTEISGFYDYTFNIIYSAGDQIPDSIVVTIQSNGGEQDIILLGKVKATSLKELNSKKIVIYPNPSSGIFYLKGDGIQFVEIYNLNGQKILDKKVDLNQYRNQKLDISNMPAGCYMMIIKSKDQKRTAVILLE